MSWKTKINKMVFNCHIEGKQTNQPTKPHTNQPNTTQNKSQRTHQQQKTTIETLGRVGKLVVFEGRSTSRWPRGRGLLRLRTPLHFSPFLRLHPPCQLGSAAPADATAWYHIIQYQIVSFQHVKNKTFQCFFDSNRDVLQFQSKTKLDQNPSSANGSPHSLLGQMKMRCCRGNGYRDATDITKVIMQVHEKVVTAASISKSRGQYIHHRNIMSEAPNTTCEITQWQIQRGSMQTDPEEMMMSSSLPIN